mmetsp:Transcript_27257/g.59554  ORF Transcript_27257/g.59554 Transcript_27257/m.59554 type:complete len:187 (-) Transcript_27257:462-1022(-)
MGRKEDVIKALEDLASSHDGTLIGKLVHEIRSACVTENMLKDIDLDSDSLVGQLQDLFATGVPDAFYASVKKSTWLPTTNQVAAETVQVANPVSPSLLAGYAGYKFLSPRRMIVNGYVIDMSDPTAPVQLGKLVMDGRGTHDDPVQIRFEGVSLLPSLRKYLNSTTVMGVLNIATTLAMGFKSKAA